MAKNYYISNFKIDHDKIVEIMPKLTHKYEYDGNVTTVEFEIPDIKSKARPFVVATNLHKVKLTRK